MSRRIFLSLGAVLLAGCATSGMQGSGRVARDWPRGNEPLMRAENGVAFGESGHVRFSSQRPMYALFLELRPSFDSLDVRMPTGVDSIEAFTGVTELLTSMETVDPMQRLTASDQATNCTNVKLGAGDATGQEVCPVSRANSRGPARSWNFKNRVFLLVSDKPFATPLPNAIPWASLRTAPPVTGGSKWTAIAL